MITHYEDFVDKGDYRRLGERNEPTEVGGM